MVGILAVIGITLAYYQQDIRDEKPGPGEIEMIDGIPVPTNPAQDAATVKVLQMWQWDHHCDRGPQREDLRGCIAASHVIAHVLAREVTAKQAKP